MRGAWPQLVNNLRLYYRNPMAVFYGYLFPTVFLLAFWVLYRYDRVPLIRHVGEFLTITVLSGACFGLPTTLVGERERGVWRRFKLAPVSTATLVVATIVARYAILITAGVWQLGVAAIVGMPLPQHPLDVFVAFTFSAFAFLGLGLVVAMLADNVPAVQALGQALFLPMLIVGGVAVPLTALPEWAQHVSAFLPGRYSVQALQAAASGGGLSEATFSLVALATIGLAACVAGGRMFRWDAQQRFLASTGKGWIAAALMAWLAIGVAAEYQGYVRIFTIADATAPASVSAGSTPPSTAPATLAESPAATPTASEAPTSGRSVGRAAAPAGQPAPGSLSPPNTAATTASGSTVPAPPPVGVPIVAGRSSSIVPAEPVAVPPPPAAVASPAPPAPTTSGSSAPEAWRAVTAQQIDEEIVFTRLPPDSGVVTPVAADNDPIDDAAALEVATLRDALRTWPPGLVPDLVQRTRNVLYVAAVVDIFQWPTEAFIPHAVFDKLQTDIPRDDLIKILYWVAVHFDEGTDTAVDQMQPLGIRNGPADAAEVRNRAGAYAVKLLGRLTGKRPGR